MKQAMGHFASDQVLRLNEMNIRMKRLMGIFLFAKYKYTVHPYENEKCCAETVGGPVEGSATCLCKLIIISAYGLHIFGSVGRSCPLPLKLILISAHWLHIGVSVGKRCLLPFKVILISAHGLPIASLDR